MSDPKLSDEQCDEIAKRYKAGEVMAKLAQKYGVCYATIRRVCLKRNASRPPLARSNNKDLTEFTQRVRSILWRQDHTKEKPTYDAWQARVAALESPDGGGCSHEQAIVRASKEYPCLYRLFREYDVGGHDPNPDSHPAIQHFGQPAVASAEPVVCEGREQSYRESLRWAIEAAGTHLRTGRQPETCPCDAAWYLYRQAVEEPKDFLAKVGQVESKGDADSDERRSLRKAGSRSIAEIDSMLAELEGA